MKKVQRNFAVEYRSGRRKPDLKSNSIWGNLDLKSVALDLEEEATPFLQDGDLASKFDGKVSQSKAEPTGPLLTSSAGQHETAEVTGEATVAHGIETTDESAVAETSIAARKQRKPRAKRAAASIDHAAEPALSSTGVAGKQKRGRKLKSSEEVGLAKRAAVTRAQRAMRAEPVFSSDEMADIVQLEEENQRLRKMLTEKLRAENADLRKRLKLD